MPSVGRGRPLLSKGLQAGKWGDGAHAEEGGHQGAPRISPRGCVRDKLLGEGGDGGKTRAGTRRGGHPAGGGRGPGRRAPPASSACEKHTLLEASMNLTPLYVMDRMMVGTFFMCSVDFYKE